MNHTQNRCLLLGAIALSACDGMTVIPGEVTQGPGATLTGTFKMQEYPKMWGGIDSDGSGGACLLVAMRDVAGYEQMKCTGKARECQPWPRGDLWKRWYTYCDLPDDAPDNAVGQCWGKRDNDWPVEVRAQLHKQSCNRSIDYPQPHPWPINADTPATQEPLQLQHPAFSGVAKPSHWRINACIKGTENGSPAMKCYWGPIKEVP